MATAVENIRIDRVNQSIQRLDEGKPLNGKNLTAEEICLAMSSNSALPPLRLTWLGLRSCMRKIINARAPRS